MTRRLIGILLLMYLLNGSVTAASSLGTQAAVWIGIELVAAAAIDASKGGLQTQPAPENEKQGNGY